MAALYCTASAANVSLTSGSASFALVGTTPSNHRIRLQVVKTLLKGVAAVDLLARLVEVTGTISGGTTITPVKTPNVGSETIQTTFVSAPSGLTAGNVLSLLYLQAGNAESLDLAIPGGTKFALELTPTGASPTVGVEFKFEE